jgi:glycosyltransferase involved in cell wall biosynthesis
VKHICFLITGLGMGGAENQVQILAQNFGKLNFHVSVISLISIDGSVIAQELTGNGIAVYSLGLPRGKLTLSGLKTFLSLIRHLKPDVLHSHMIHANILSRMIRLISRKIRIINTAHSINEGTGLIIQLYSKTNFLAHFCSQVSLEGYEKYIREKIFSKANSQYIPNAIENTDMTQNRKRTQNLRFTEMDKINLICVARLDEVKNHANLINAIFSLQSKFPGIRLNLVGDGVLKDSLKEQVKHLNLENQVFFLGVRRNIPQLLNESDAFILVSHWEGMPMSLLEAASLKLPIVATNVGGIQSFLDEGRCGFLIPYPSVKDIADSLDRFFHESADERENRAQNAYVKIQNDFGVKKIVKFWGDIYFPKNQFGVRSEY